MPEFDPYLQWLGIRDPERPVNHYRILGVDPFEADPNIIAMSADRQMEHVRSFQNGPQGVACQDLLSELAIARRCLLTPHAKQAYDQNLQAQSSPAVLVQPNQLALAKTADIDVAVSPTGSMSAGLQVAADSGTRKKRQKRERMEALMMMIGWVTGAVAALGIGGYIVTSGIIKTAGDESQPNDAPTDQSLALAPVEELVAAANEAPTNSSPSTNGNADRDLTNRRPQTPSSRTSSEAGVEFPLFNGPEDFLNFPRPDRTALMLINRSSRSINRKNWELLAPSTKENQGNREFLATPESGGLLVGLVVSQFQNDNIKSLQPVFLTAEGLETGRMFGQRTTPRLILARPGFAIGGLEVTATDPIGGLRVEFMKIGDSRLERDSDYFSNWLGTSSGKIVRTQDREGWPIVGIHGKYLLRSNVSSLGLIMMHGGDSNLNGLTNLAESTLKTDASKPAIDPFSPTAMANSPLLVGAARKKLPIPNKKDIAAAEAEIQELYRSRFEMAVQAKTEAQFAKRVLSDGQQSLDPIAKYVMLNKVLELATLLGDAQLAISVVDQLDLSFEIEFEELAQSAIEATGKNVSTATETNFKTGLDDLIERFVTERNFDAAKRFSKQGRDLAKRARRTDVAKFYQRKEKMIDEYEKLIESNLAAEQVLERTPKDNAANLTHGDFLFVVEKRRDTAVKHWAQSGDPVMEEIAKFEVASEDLGFDDANRFQLAEAWESVGQQNVTLRDFHCLERALELYAELRYSAVGLDRERIKSKIEMLSRLLGK